MHDCDGLRDRGNDGEEKDSRNQADSTDIGYSSGLGHHGHLGREMSEPAGIRLWVRHTSMDLAMVMTGKIIQYRRGAAVQGGIDPTLLILEKSLSVSAASVLLAP